MKWSIYQTHSPFPFNNLKTFKVTFNFRFKYKIGVLYNKGGLKMMSQYLNMLVPIKLLFYDLL
jgi:hypothetical protein